MKTSEKKFIEAMMADIVSISRGSFEGFEDFAAFHFEPEARRALLDQLKVDGLKGRALAKKVNAFLYELEVYITIFVLVPRIFLVSVPRKKRRWPASVKLDRIAKVAQELAETICALIFEDPEVFSSLDKAHHTLGWRRANIVLAKWARMLNRPMPPLPSAPDAQPLLSPILVLAISALELADTLNRLEEKLAAHAPGRGVGAHHADNITMFLLGVACLFKERLDVFPSREMLNRLLTIALDAAGVSITPAAQRQRILRFMRMLSRPV